MLFIGGTGGSGTRLVSLFCSKLGYNIGSYVNKSLDAMHLESFYRQYTRKYLEETVDKEKMKERLIKCINLHIGDVHSSERRPLCSIKNTRSLLLLPFIHSVYPDMKFVHIVRSGISMAFSGHRRHVRSYGDIFTHDTDIDGSFWSPELAIKVWSDTNLAAFDYGTKYLKNNYFLVKFENLGSEKISVYKNLVKFLGCSEDAIPSLTRKAHIPETWKRGRKGQSKDLLIKLEKIGENAIDNFGYKFWHLRR